MSSFIEYDDTKSCPCGSQRPYCTCCKSKGIKWGYDQGGKLVKQVPITSEIGEALKTLEKMFAQYYGRDPGEGDYVFSFAPIYQDEILFKTMQALQASGMPPEDIYAYYKTDGLLLCDQNDALIPEKDQEDFLSYRDEYCKAIEETHTDSINSLQFTVYGNQLLRSAFDKAQKMLVNSLNDFIHRHSDQPNGIYHYEMKGEIDYLLFSAIKTIKTIKGIALIVEEQIPECIHALGRSLFENYMYLNKINCDPNFFKQKLLPKVDQENFCAVKKENGKIDPNKVFHIETGEIYDVRVIIAELKRSFSDQEDQDLYDLYYGNACQYIHVDVASATNYFSTYDPYDELNPSLQAAIVATDITVLLYHALIHNQFVDPQFRQDATYLIKQLIEELLGATELLNSDPEHKQPIFSTVLKRLQTLLAEAPDEAIG